ncbi:N-acetylmuramoyl-L-alanine amidase family protein [Clostridium sp. C2-6-12]|uniref:N-acetylmuramoyl-L-alanine amidase family protein n=1 Tax=Clostridium sp. C2-6-12 TaxID=2698832 RepID=UPI00136FF3F0|nr:N-acetylmuramoyl-L-alanine amidase family protein [Clostridium sp. C2-6-12]
MIKRVSKATSLLLAAAAVMSLVPAASVSAAERLETKEGTIEQAIAFDGGYIFNGYKADTDETGVYYNKGDKDKLIEDLSSSDMAEYGSKYAKVSDMSEDYLVDLTTGKVVDETIEDIKDSVATKLKSTLSKTDRYGKITTANIGELKEVVSGQFADNWFSYEVTTSGGATLHGYVNEAGKYVDTDVTANMYVYNGTKMVKIENFGKTDKDNNLTVNLVGTKTIAQDKDYIYRLADVNVVSATTTAQATYVQKISKAQGVDEDGAYLPNVVASYEITSNFDSGSADDAKSAFDAYKTANYSGVDFRVINGVVYATKTAGKKVTVTTFKLKKDKVAVDNTTAKLDAYLVEQDVDKDQDIMGEKAVSIDVNGNTWVLNKGDILKFDGSEFKTVYNVDRAMDTLEVYNEKSLLAWEDGENVYAAVNDKDVLGEVGNGGNTQTPVQNKGWVKAAEGWTFYNNDGSQVKGQWVQDGGVWYMIKANGIMATGWYNDNGTWYYLAGSGAMKTGWINDNGTWYYLAGSGAMKTGWINDNGTWYYLAGSGAMLANTVVDGYKLGASGAWVK